MIRAKFPPGDRRQLCAESMPPSWGRGSGWGTGVFKVSQRPREAILSSPPLLPSFLLFSPLPSPPLPSPPLPLSSDFLFPSIPHVVFFFFSFYFGFDTWFHYVPWVSLEPVLFRSQPPEHWDCPFLKYSKAFLKPLPCHDLAQPHSCSPGFLHPVPNLPTDS